MAKESILATSFSLEIQDVVEDVCEEIRSFIVISITAPRIPKALHSWIIPVKMVSSLLFIFSSWTHYSRQSFPFSQWKNSLNKSLSTFPWHKTLFWKLYILDPFHVKASKCQLLGHMVNYGSERDLFLYFWRTYFLLTFWNAFGLRIYFLSLPCLWPYNYFLKSHLSVDWSHCFSFCEGKVGM